MSHANLQGSRQREMSACELHDTRPEAGNGDVLRFNQRSAKVAIANYISIIGILAEEIGSAERKQVASLGGGWEWFKMGCNYKGE